MYTIAWLFAYALQPDYSHMQSGQIFSITRTQILYKQNSAWISRWSDCECDCDCNCCCNCDYVCDCDCDRYMSMDSAVLPRNFYFAVRDKLRKASLFSTQNALTIYCFVYFRLVQCVSKTIWLDNIIELKKYRNHLKTFSAVLEAVNIIVIKNRTYWHYI